MTSRSLRISRRLSLSVLAVVLASLVAGCGASGSDPGPTPATFTGIVASFRAQGILISNVLSGDPGCNDPTLTPTAISFNASGLDQATPTRVRLYIFRDGSVYTRLRSEVDTCARSYVKDPAQYMTVDLSPYVATGVGPWGAEFKAHLRTALAQAVSPDGIGI